MNYRFRFLLVLLLTVTLVGNKVTAQRRLINNQIRSEGTESDYLFAFTRATKLYVFGDYGNALNLYRECLRYEPESPALNYQISLIYTKGGDIESAKHYARVAYDQDTKNEWYALQYARLCQGAGLYDSALYVYKGLLKGTFEDAELYLMMSQIMEKKGSYNEAITYLNKIETELGITQEVTVNKARIYNETGDTKTALKELRKALSLNSNDYIIRGVMAEMFRDSKQSDSAEYYYRSIIGGHKDDPNVVFSYAEFLLGRKKIEEARRLYLEALGNEEIEAGIKLSYLYNGVQNENMFRKLYPVLDTLVSYYYWNNLSDIRAKALYADYLYRSKEYNKTINVLKEIIKVNDGNYAAWEQLLFCFNSLEQGDSVIFYGRVAVRNFADEPMSYLLTASALYEKKEYNEAIDLLKTALPYSENTRIESNVISLLAECYSRTKQLTLSDAMYERAIAADSTDIVALNNYAYSLAERNMHLDKAEKMSLITVRRDPENGTYLDTYGWIRFRQGNYKEALMYVKMALKRQGDMNPEILSHMGDIYKKMGKSKTAKKYWERALVYAKEDLKVSLEEKLK